MSASDLAPRESMEFIFTPVENLALRGHKKLSKQIEAGRLASTVWPDECMYAAATNL